MKRREFIGGLGSGAALAACVPQSETQSNTRSTEHFSWKMVTTWIPNFPGLGTGANTLPTGYEDNTFLTRYRALIESSFPRTKLSMAAPYGLRSGDTLFTGLDFVAGRLFRNKAVRRLTGVPDLTVQRQGTRS